MGWLRERAVIPTTHEGEIRCLGEPGIDALPDQSQAPIRWLATEQSNSSLIVGNVAMIKLIRRVSPGVHPEAEMTRRLTFCGFANAPQLLGEIVRIDPKDTPHTLFIIQSAIPNQGDAWTWMTDNLRRALEDAALEKEAGAQSPHTFSLLNEFVAVVGRRLGEMHVALAAETNDPAFAPEVADDEVVSGWAKDAAEQIERGMSDLERARQTLGPERQALADSVLSRKADLMASLPALAEHGRGGLSIRIHGDFHLGQILVSQSDAYIIDFEGEPLRSLEQRRQQDDAFAGRRRLSPLARLRLGLVRLAGHQRKPANRPRAPREALDAVPEGIDHRVPAGLLAFGQGRPTAWPGPGERAASQSDDAGKGGLRNQLRGRQPAELAGHSASRLRGCRQPPENGSATRMTIGQDCLVGIDAEAVQALVDGRHGDPFSILGPHSRNSMSIVRALAPGAQAIDVVAREDSSLLGRLELAHPGGLFAGPVVGGRPYRLRIVWPNAVQETEDPYSFGLLLGELDLHLIAQGTHYELGRCLGAQAMTIGGVEGVRFAVWAPNARRVSVVGDFNTWDGRRHPMRLRREAGVWELFVPRIGPGALYKYELLGPDGALLAQKADPVARDSEASPGTGSIVASNEPFVWTDGAWIADRAKRQNLDAPMSFYEVHAGSWLRIVEEDFRSLTWTEMGERLVPYLVEMGFTHLEFLPIAEYPFGELMGLSAARPVLSDRPLRPGSGIRRAGRSLS